MARSDSKNEFDQLYEAAMPALSRAAVGDFGAEIELDRENSAKLNELLAGVSVLLDVIREQARELEEAKVKLQGGAETSRLPLLDEVLGRPEH
jgi:hypothetical protein